MREIRGWQIGQVVTAAEMTDNTANLEMTLADQSNDQLPCIYNGLTLQSQSGSGNSIVTFNPGVARCQNLPLSVYTYLPTNPYGTSYPCFIDISVLDTNNTITLATTPTSGFVVATFSISPNTSGQINYLITGSLLQIATGDYDPAQHVKLCAYTYSGSFSLDFTPGTNRDFDWIGPTGLQWNYQNSSLNLNTPPGLSGTAFNVASGITTTFNGPTNLNGATALGSGAALRFYDPANTNYSALEAGALSTNTTWKLPLTDGAANSYMATDGSGNLSFSTPGVGNIAANDSNVVFTASSNPVQYCLPTAARTYTMPASGISAGVSWTIYNRATTDGLGITLQTSGSNTITIVPPNGFVTLTPLTTTPTTAASWIVKDRQSTWTSFMPTITGFGTITTQIGAFYKFYKDSMFFNVIWQAGTVNGSLASITMPSQFVVDSTKAPFATTTSNAFSPTMGTYQRGNNAAANGSVLICVSTSTTLIYLGYNVGGGGTSSLQAAPANLMCATSEWISTNFQIPVT